MAKARTSRSGATFDMGCLSASMGFILRRAQINISDTVIRLLERFDLRPSEFSVLVMIQANPGLRVSDLSTALGFHVTNLGPQLHKLQQRGLVGRLPSRTDKRAQTLQLTARGRKLVGQAELTLDDFEASLQELIGRPSSKLLFRQLKRLAEHDYQEA